MLYPVDHLLGLSQAKQRKNIYHYRSSRTHSYSKFDLQNTPLSALCPYSTTMEPTHKYNVNEHFYLQLLCSSAEAI